MVILLAGELIHSCSTIPPAIPSGIIRVNTETRKNGYLLNIVVDRPVGDVSTFIAQEHWLIVTVVDSSLDTKLLKSFTSAFIDKLEITRFPTALQLAFRLNVHIESVEVIHPDHGKEIAISLFSHRKPEANSRM